MMLGKVTETIKVKGRTYHLMGRSQDSEAAKKFTRTLEKEGWNCVWAFPEKPKDEIIVYCRKMRG